MKAGEVHEGDALAVILLGVQSVMHEGEATYVYWGERRSMDTFDSKEEVKVIPKTCPSCGHPIIGEGWAR